MAIELPALPYDRTALEPHISGETIEKISVTALPFAVASTLAIFIIALFPQIALWLPALLGY